MYNKHYRFLQLSFIILFLNFIIESLLLSQKDRTQFIIIQNLSNIIFFIGFFISFKDIKYSKFYKIILIILIYNWGLGIFSSDPIITFNFLLKFSIPIIYLIIGYNVFINKNLLKFLLEKSWMFLCYFTIYIIFVNTLKIGESIYMGGLLIGYYSLNGLYLPTFAILVVLFNYHYIESKKYKFLNIFFAITTTLILILLLKRTLILILIVGFVFYLIRNLTFIKLLKLTILSSILIFLFSFYFTTYFENSFKSREDRFSNEYDVTKEGRFTENYSIYELMKDSPIQLIFGSGEVFNDRKFTSPIFEQDREAHNSYIRTFWNGGFLGVLIFILFYIKQFKELFIYLRFTKFYASKSIQDLFYFAIVFVFLRFLNDFSSGITYLGYNAYSYLLIGGTLRIGQELKNLIRNNVIKNSGNTNKSIINLNGVSF